MQMRRSSFALRQRRGGAFCVCVYCAATDLLKLLAVPPGLGRVRVSQSASGGVQVRFAPFRWESPRQRETEHRRGGLLVAIPRPGHDY